MRAVFRMPRTPGGGHLRRMHVASLHSLLPVDPVPGSGAAGAARGAAGAVPEWVQLVPAGRFHGRDGRGPYRLDDAAGVILASMAAVKLPIDENHATDFAMTTGQASPARGWIVAMEAREGSVWGRVEWTPSGNQMMAEGAYRGISPVFQAHEKTGVISRILRAALTNVPNLPQLATLHSQEPFMDPTALRAALGLPATADEATVLATITANAAVASTHAAQLTAIATAAGAADATPAALVTHLQTMRSTTVPTDQVVALQTQLDTLKGERAREKAVAVVDGAITAGKPVNAIREQLISQHMANPASVETMLAGLPSINAGGIIVAPLSGQAGALSAMDKQVAHLMGLDPVKYAAHIKTQSEGAAQ